MEKYASEEIQGLCPKILKILAGKEDTISARQLSKLEAIVSDLNAVDTDLWISLLDNISFIKSPFSFSLNDVDSILSFLNHLFSKINSFFTEIVQASSAELSFFDYKTKTISWEKLREVFEASNLRLPKKLKSDFDSFFISESLKETISLANFFIFHVIITFSVFFNENSPKKHLKKDFLKLLLLQKEGIDRSLKQKWRIFDKKRRHLILAGLELGELAVDFDGEFVESVNSAFLAENCEFLAKINKQKIGKFLTLRSENNFVDAELSEETSLNDEDILMLKDFIVAD